jgi:hypothetical protein
MMQIKVVTAYRGECPYRDNVTRNLTEYCRRWGYDLVAKFDQFEPLNRLPVWTKLQVVMSEFHDCDWLLWVDADCLVMNMTTPLTKFIDDGFDVGVAGKFASHTHCKSCGLRRPEVVSAGILLLRNSEWCQEFLAEWWDSENVPWRPVDHECHWNGDSAWLSCYARQSQKMASHIRVFDLATIGWATYTGNPNQFIMHFYGGTTVEQMLAHEQRVIR